MFVKIVVQELPPILLAGIRFIFAAIIIFAIAAFTLKDWNLSKKRLWNAVIAGFLFLTLGNGGMSYALQYVDSGFAALVVSAQPLMLLIMLWFMDRKPILPRSWVGVALGMIGMYLLISQNQIISSPNQWIGLLCIFGCLLSWGFGSIFVSKADLPRSFFINSGAQMLTAGITLLLLSYLLFGEKMPPISTVSPRVWYSLLFLIVFGSIIAFTAFNYLLKHVSPEKVSTSTYINPIVAMLLGWSVLGELITTQSMVAAAVLLTGVYFINVNKTGRAIKRP